MIQALREEGKHLPARARKKIVKMLCREIVEKKEELYEYRSESRRRGRPDYMGVTLLAEMMGVSRKTVSRWLNNEMQCSNANLEKMLGIANTIMPHKLSQLLHEDLREHEYVIKQFLANDCARAHMCTLMPISGMCARCFSINS